LSVTFVHCAQTAEDIDTISFTHYTALCLSQTMSKFGLHRSTEVTTTVDLSVGFEGKLQPSG